MRRAWIAGIVCVGLGAGAWGCNAVLGINDPIHAEETDAQPPADASAELAQDQAAPDDAAPDILQPDSDQPDSVIPPDQTAPDGNIGPDAPGPDSAEPDGPGPDSPATLQAREVGVGDLHSCAVMYDGTVRCWGSGFDGALGNDDIAHQKSPVQVVKTGGSPLAGAARVDGGWRTTCALMSDSTVSCWGLNSSGEYGSGTTSTLDTADSQAVLTGITNYSVGFEHVCAAAAGSAYCWGSNLYKKSGSDQVSSYTKPHQISNMTGVTAVAAGYDHSCAVHSGNVSCWGKNFSGQLGNNTDVSSDSPVGVVACGNPASPLSGVNALATGARHSCALLANKTVWCWGDGSDGALGTGNIKSSLCAVQVIGINTAERIAAGTNHTCAIITGGKLFCWGDDSYGQIGDGFMDDVLLPNNVLENVTAVGGGDGHTCAVKNDGTVWCWGDNAYGQLGTGDNDPHLTPVQVAF